MFDSFKRLVRKHPLLSLAALGAALIYVPNAILFNLAALDEYCRWQGLPRFPDIPTWLIQITALPTISFGVILIGAAVIGTLRRQRSR